MIIILINSETWAKCINGDCYNGIGTYTYDNGNKYVGNWKNGERHGEGTFFGESGSIYQGGWNDGIREGKETKYINANGDIFEGEYQGGMLKYGKKTYANGDIYVGNFFYRYRQGFGSITYSNGDRYVGVWDYDLMDGLGEYTYFNGTINKGYFEDGKFFGSKAKWDKKEKREKIAREKREKIAREKRKKIVKEEKEKYQRIYNACLLDKSKEVDMQVSAISEAVYKTCKDIAVDPSWYENFKYNK